MTEIASPVLGSLSTLYTEIDQDVQIFLGQNLARPALVDRGFRFAVSQQPQWGRVGGFGGRDEGDRDRGGGDGSLRYIRVAAAGKMFEFQLCGWTGRRSARNLHCTEDTSPVGIYQLPHRISSVRFQSTLRSGNSPSPYNAVLTSEDVATDEATFLATSYDGAFYSPAKGESACSEIVLSVSRQPKQSMTFMTPGDDSPRPER